MYVGAGDGELVLQMRRQETVARLCYVRSQKVKLARRVRRAKLRVFVFDSLRRQGMGGIRQARSLAYILHANICEVAQLCLLDLRTKTET